MGFKVLKGEYGFLLYKDDRKLPGRFFDEDKAWKDAGNYCTDHAASLEVEKAAIKVDAEGYVRFLYVVKANAQTGVNIPPKDIAHWPHLSINIVATLFLATPRERAEAAYMTLQAYQVDKQ
jgi:hypothetical protein